MSLITIRVPGRKLEYDVAFSRDGARFHVFQVWDENARNVTGAERAAVVEHALSCYHAEMVAAARRPWKLAPKWPRHTHTGRG